MKVLVVSLFVRACFEGCLLMIDWLGTGCGQAVDRLTHGCRFNYDVRTCALACECLWNSICDSPPMAAMFSTT